MINKKYVVKVINILTDEVVRCHENLSEEKAKRLETAYLLRVNGNHYVDVREDN